MTEVPAWLIAVAAVLGVAGGAFSVRAGFLNVFDSRAAALIERLQIAGKLPTPDQLATIIADQEKLEQIERRIENGLLTRVDSLEIEMRRHGEKLDRLLGRVDPWDGFTERRDDP